MKQSSVLKIKLSRTSEDFPSYHTIKRTHPPGGGGEILYYSADNDGYICIDLSKHEDAKVFAHYVLADADVFQSYLDWKVANDQISVDDWACIGEFFLNPSREVLNV